MKKFKDLGIKIESKNFIGSKIKIYKVVNKEIIVHDYNIDESKIYKNSKNNKCLCLQISLDNKKHIIFTSATGLIDALNKTSKDDFPFITTIIENNNKYLFT